MGCLHSSSVCRSYTLSQFPEEEPSEKQLIIPPPKIIVQTMIVRSISFQFHSFIDLLYNSTATVSKFGKGFEDNTDDDEEVEGLVGRFSL